MNLSKTTTAPTTKKPLQKSTNSLTSSLSKLLGLTSTKPKVNDDNTNVIKASDQSPSAKIETEAENIATIIPDLRAIQDKLNVKLPTESETVKEDVFHQNVQEYKVRNEEEENETLPDIKPEALLTVPIVSDLDIKILKPSTIDINRTSSPVSDGESKQPIAESPLPSIEGIQTDEDKEQEDIESSNEPMLEELSIVRDSANLAKIVQSASIFESTDQFTPEFNTEDPTVLDNLSNVGNSDQVVTVSKDQATPESCANTTKHVTDAESVEELLEIPPLNQQEMQIDVVLPVLDDDGPINLTNPTTESLDKLKAEKLSVPEVLPTVPCLPELLCVLPLKSEVLQSDGLKRSTEVTNLDTLTNVDPVVNIQPEVPTDLPISDLETRNIENVNPSNVNAEEPTVESLRSPLSVVEYVISTEPNDCNSPKISVSLRVPEIPNDAVKPLQNPTADYSFGQFDNFYNYRSRPLIDIHDNEINLVKIVFD